MVQPQPLSSSDISASATASLEAAMSGQEPVTRPIDLAEAMARAVKYNLDNRVQQLQAGLRSRELSSATLAMLPTLAANAGYSGRNNVDASSSYNLFTKSDNFQASTSNDKDVLTGDLTLSWNVLDFGLSYVRAEQAADRVLAAREERRRVMARTIEDVRAAHWRALAAEYLGRELRSLQGRVQAALKQSNQLIERGQASPVTALTYQRELYEIVERIQTVEAEVASARNQLATLMNLPPGTRFSLVRPSSAALPGGFRETPEQMVKVALAQRPEIRQALYEQRSGDLDEKAILLELLPGINLRVGPNATSNSYTYNQDWLGWGSAVSANLLKIATYPARKAEVDARNNLLEAKLKATVASVALQVHVSRIRYELARQRADTLANYSQVQQKLLAQLTASATADQSGENEVVREQLTALLAKARHDVAVADAQAAFAAVQTTMGRDPYPDVDTASLAELAAAFRRGPGPVATGRKPDPKA